MEQCVVITQHYDMIVGLCDGKIRHGGGKKEIMMIELDIIMVHHSNMLVLLSTVMEYK